MPAAQSLDLGRMIAPVSEDDFFREYWETQPLFVPGSDPERFDCLLSVEAFDRVLHFTRPKPPALRVLKEQVELLPDRYLLPTGGLDLNQLYKAYAEGHTMVVNGLDSLWPALGEFCQRLRERLNHHVIANAYLSPASSRGLLPHFDTHDVFVLQVSGAKTWEIFEPPQRTPLLTALHPVLPDETLGTPLQRFELRAGNLLYLPRGYVHRAVTGGSPSLHLTVGIYPAQGYDLVIAALTALSYQDPRFRQALPPGYLDVEDPAGALAAKLRELTEALAREARAGDALGILADRFVREGQALPDGHFAHVDALGSITLATAVEKRRGMRCRVIHAFDGVRIQFPGNMVKGPWVYAAGFNFVAGAPGAFAVAELPDELGDERKLEMVRRLIRGGLLRVATAQRTFD